MRKIQLILIVSIIVNIELNANHLIGGELTYQCEGDNNYNIELSIYRDCNCTMCADFDNPALITIFDGDNNFLQSEELYLTGRRQIPPNINNLCLDALPGICVEKAIGYKKSIKLPPSDNGYHLVYQRCCRNNATANIAAAGDTGSTYHAIIPVDSIAKCNASPVFNSLPPIAICVGYPFEFDHSATDADGDSLSYELCTPFSGATSQNPQPIISTPPPYSPISWETGFSVTNPLISNTQFSLNAFTGQLSGLPTAVGEFVVGVCVKEFRNGVLLNTSIRDFQFNVIDCAIAEFLSTCVRPNKIQTHIFYDVNQNQIKEPEEILINNLSIQIDPLGILGFPNNLNQGIFFVNPGDYAVSYNAENNTNWQLTSDTASHSFTLMMDETKIVNFGVYPNEQISNIQTVIAAPPTRCNDTIPFDIIAKNIGTTVADGILWFKIDSLAMPVFTIEPDTTIIPNTYGWFFTDLYPSYHFTQTINLAIPGPVLVEQVDTSFFQLAEAIQFQSRVDYNDVNGSQSSTNFEYSEIRCSFDPNDKLVNPSREGNYTLFEEALTYTIRFQNTGNDEAYNILIKDTIDSNLDVTSIQIISSSHLDKLNTKLSDGLVFSFEFRDIFLPDSTSNPTGSQGYVTYTIKPKTRLAENTVIKNSAAIFFDLNPHIQTNTVESRMVSELPVVSVIPQNSLPKLSVWPNPSTGFFTIDEMSNSKYTVFNVFGQTVQNGKFQRNSTFDISTVPKGVYFIQVEKNGHSIVERIVKM